MNNGNTTAPNYLNEALAIAADLKAGVHHIEVKHEYFCKLLNGKGACNCKAQAKLMVPS